VLTRLGGLRLTLEGLKQLEIAMVGDDDECVVPRGFVCDWLCIYIYI